jgi:hypothetical protein
MNVSGDSSDATVPAVKGTNSAPGPGVLGIGKVGLVGAASAPTQDFSKGFFSVGVQGLNAAIGVVGDGTVAGVVGEGTDGVGVRGLNRTNNAEGFLGGTNPFAAGLPMGVFGQSDHTGVAGITNKPNGVGVYGGSVGGVRNRCNGRERRWRWCLGQQR